MTKSLDVFRLHNQIMDDHEIYQEEVEKGLHAKGKSKKKKDKQLNLF